MEQYRGEQSGSPLHKVFVRLSSIIAPAGPIPVSKSTWWQGGEGWPFPEAGQARRQDHRLAVEDIRDLFERLGHESATLGGMS
jgi:prophage regulatory protein